jgi:protease I
MANELEGRTVAFLMANAGVEQAELTGPRDALTKAGAKVVLIAPEKGEIQAFDNDVEKADTFDADLAVADADPADYDLLVLPGGTTNPDALRLEDDAVAFVTTFAGSGKPVGAICHGPWTLIEADVVRGKTLASWPSLKTDIRNAGGEWRDEQVFRCPAQGYVLITSRNPDDIPAFGAALVKELSA